MRNASMSLCYIVVFFKILTIDMINVSACSLVKADLYLMSVIDLVTQGARASTALVLTMFSWYILASEYVTYTGPLFNIKFTSYQYRKSHCGNKTILRPSYLHNGISYTGKTTSLYWIRAQIVVIHEHGYPLYVPSQWWDIKTFFMFAINILCLVMVKGSPNYLNSVDCPSSNDMTLKNVGQQIDTVTGTVYILKTRQTQTKPCTCHAGHILIVKHDPVTGNAVSSFHCHCLILLTHWGQDKIADISQTTFSNAFSWMKMYEFRLRFHWSLFLRFQLTVFQYWFR